MLKAVVSRAQAAFPFYTRRKEYDEKLFVGPIEEHVVEEPCTLVAAVGGLLPWCSSASLLLSGGESQSVLFMFRWCRKDLSLLLLLFFSCLSLPSSSTLFFFTTANEVPFQPHAAEVGLFSPTGL